MLSSKSLIHVSTSDLTSQRGAGQLRVEESNEDMSVLISPVAQSTPLSTCHKACSAAVALTL
eukprot:12423693-Karenia_brevis.AAC.1